MIPDLQSRVKPGSIYLGVGPEQNYRYMTTTRPKMAVIFDICGGGFVNSLGAIVHEVKGC